MRAEGRSRTAATLLARGAAAGARRCARPRPRGRAARARRATRRGRSRPTRRPRPLSPRDLASRWSAARLRGEGDAAPRAGDRGTSRPRSSQAPANLFLLVRLVELLRAGRATRPAAVAASRSAARPSSAGDPKLDQALARGAGRRSRRATPSAASLKYRVVENLLRATPRYQQARHDVEPGVVGPAARGLVAGARGAPARARALRAIPVTFAPKPDAGLCRRSRGSPPCASAGKDAPRPRLRRGRRGCAWPPASGTGFRAGPPIPGSARRRPRGGRRDRTRARSTSSRPARCGSATGEGYRRVAIAAGRARHPVRLRRRRRPRPLRLVEVRATIFCATTSTGPGPTSRQRPALPQGLASRAAVAADFDRDGDLDLFSRAPAGASRSRQPARRAPPVREAGLPKSGSPGRRGGRPERRRAVGPRLDGESRRVRGAQPRRRRLPAGASRSAPGRSPLLFDFDNDGSLDLFLAAPQGAVGALPQRRGGQLRPRRASGRCPPARDAEAVDCRRRRRSRPRPRAHGRSGARSSRTAEATRTAGSTSRSRAFRPARRRSTGSATAPRSRPRPRTSTSTASASRAGHAPGARLAPARPTSCAIVWTNGVPQNALDPPVRTLVREVQQLKGSCPFLYAFDGARLALRDRRARAQPGGPPVRRRPPGGRRHAGVARHPGRVLGAVRRGALTLDFTEELWETAYFDLAELSRRGPSGRHRRSSPNEKMVPPPFPAEEPLHVSRAR